MIDRVMVEYRRASARDAGALVAPWDEAYAHGRSDDGVARLERALADDHLVCVVAEAGSTTARCATPARRSTSA